MSHPITQKLKKITPPLATGEAISIYVSGVHRKRADGPLSHAFGIVFEFASGRKEKAITSVSDLKETNNQRAELGAVLTALEWLTLNDAKHCKIVICSATKYVSEWLHQNIAIWIHEEKRANLDLLRKLHPLMKEFPAIRWEHTSESLRPERHEEACGLANAALDRRFDERTRDEAEPDFLEDAFISVDDELWMRRAIERDRL